MQYVVIFIFILYLTLFLHFLDISSGLGLVSERVYFLLRIFTILFILVSFLYMFIGTFFKILF